LWRRGTAVVEEAFLADDAAVTVTRLAGDVRVGMRPRQDGRTWSGRVPREGYGPGRARRDGALAAARNALRQPSVTCAARQRDLRRAATNRSGARRPLPETPAPMLGRSDGRSTLKFLRTHSGTGSTRLPNSTTMSIGQQHTITYNYRSGSPVVDHRQAHRTVSVTSNSAGQITRLRHSPAGGRTRRRGSPTACRPRRSPTPVSATSAA
jgi:hypothetical protein